MNILVSVNRKYVRYLLVLMASAYFNHPGEQVTFYVLGRRSELEGEAEEEITAYAKSWNQTAFVLYVPEEQWASFPTTPRWSTEMYFWLMAHEYLPQDMERCLTMDVDMVIDRNFSDFYHMDFQGNYIAACYSGGDFHRFFYSGINYPRNNCNSGTVLMNLPLWRENITMQTWIDAAAAFTVRVSDERILNHVLWEKTLIREACYYNCSPAYYNFYTQNSKTRGVTLQKPAIIHYLFVPKPWDVVDGSCAFHAVWWKYAKMTPHYHELLLEMRAKTDYYNRIVTTYQNRIRQLKSHGTLFNNVMRFLTDLHADYMTNRRFQAFMERYQGKSVSVLKANDRVASFFLDDCERYGVNVIFQTPVASLEALSEQEFAQCRTADVIVNCHVHSRSSPERDGVRPVMIWDILKSDEMAPPR